MNYEEILNFCESIRTDEVWDEVCKYELKCLVHSFWSFNDELEIIGCMKFGMTLHECVMLYYTSFADRWMEVWEWWNVLIEWRRGSSIYHLDAFRYLASVNHMLFFL